VGAITLSSLIPFSRLAHDAGDEMSGRKAAPVPLQSAPR
jgi:hypothetical protein